MEVSTVYLVYKVQFCNSTGSKQHNIMITEFYLCHSPSKYGDLL